MKNITKALSKYVHELNIDDVPDEILELTRLYIADYFAASFAGYKLNGVFNDAVFGMMKKQGGLEEATVFPGRIKLPVENAAYMNAIYAHGADMDDGNKKAMGHPAVICSLYERQ